MTLDTHQSPTLAFIRKKQKAMVLTLLTVMAVVFALAFFLGQSIRFDEAETVWASSKHISSVLQFSAQNFESPLYLLLLHGWEIMFGTDIVLARILSLIFFIGAIWAMYWLGKAAYDKKHGLFAA